MARDKLRRSHLWVTGRKMSHVGGTFVQSLVAGDLVEIKLSSMSQHFVYSDGGGGVLTFRGELIALSGFQ